MKTSLTKRPRYAAFTLIEMIGVLAVIAILASLLIPKILNAINDAKINNAVLSYNSIKTAVMEHYGKYGKICGTNGATLAASTSFSTNFDTKVLLAEGFIDKPFVVKAAGSTSYVRAIPGTSVTTVAAANSADFSFDDTLNNGTANASFVIEAVIPGVSASDAKAINDRLDGELLGAGQGSADLKGRVKFDAIAPGAVGDVYIYISHR